MKSKVIFSPYSWLISCLILHISNCAAQDVSNSTWSSTVPGTDVVITCSITKELALIRAGEAGDLDAQLTMGLKYSIGYSCPPENDSDKAVYWYEKAAKQGSPLAMSRLGNLYRDGGVNLPPNSAISDDWYLKAASAGDVYSINVIGIKYGTGHFGKPDWNQAASFFNKGVALNSAESMKNLGDMYDQGSDDFPKDQERAFEWYKKAAETGWAPLQEKIALLYYYGQGVEKDYKQTAAWMYKAASHGLPSAIQQLGTIYEFGIGVNSDKVVALHLLAIAKEFGNENAKKMFAELRITMPNRSSVDAETNAQKWMGKMMKNSGHVVPPLPVPSNRK